MSKAYIVTDLGFGDAGKGSITDYLCSATPVDWVIRYNGGAQAGHNVIVGNKHHTFSSFGSGTFRGVKTYLSEYFVLHLPALLKEATVLELYKGIPNPLSLIYIHPKCKVSTAWHIGLNYLHELSRGTAAHGSCGYGVGATMEDYLTHTGSMLIVEDFSNKGVLISKLTAIYNRLLPRARELIPLCPASADLERAKQMFSSQTIQETYDYILAHSRALQVCVDPWRDSETVVFEGAQGVLLDENYGFHPYTTWSTTTSANARVLCDRYKFTPTVLGLTRAYSCRHGPGPFPTANTLSIEEPHNITNQWQKDFRTGALDIPLLEYAIHANQGIDYLVISHLDKHNTLSPVCSSYNLAFSPKQLPATLSEQAALCNYLSTVTPAITQLAATLLPQFLASKLNTPLGILSYGPTASQKKLLPGFAL
jgi:adenylosuccinate synthase